jgi:RecG-like helicase
VIRREKTLVIADEGHNYGTKLSLVLIESVEPSFVLELTATPAPRSNVLCEVDLVVHPEAPTGFPLREGAIVQGTFCLSGLLLR